MKTRKFERSIRVMEYWSDAKDIPFHQFTNPSIHQSIVPRLHHFITPLLPSLLLLALLLGLPSQCLAQGGPPVITQQPQSRTVFIGSSVSFTVTVSSVTFPTYQWRFNGGSISAATASSYTIASVQSSNAGNYSV